MTTQEVDKLSSVLSANATQEEVNKVCQSILSNRLLYADMDYPLRLLLKDLIKCINMPLSYQNVEVEATEPKVSSSQGKNKIAYYCLAIIALLLIPLGSFWALLAGVLALIAGFCIGKTTKHLSNPHKEVKQVLSTTVEELSSQVDAVYNQISQFFNYQQIEGKYLDILIWLQRQYSESEDDKFKKSIAKLANRHGYTFNEFSEEHFECFESSTANVDFPTTTLYAVINTKSNKLICKGHVVLPM